MKNVMRNVKENKVVQSLRGIGKSAADKVRGFLSDENGMGTVEVILIIVVLIGLVIVFKKEIDGLVSEIFKTINADAAKVTG